MREKSPNICLEQYEYHRLRKKKEGIHIKKSVQLKYPNSLRTKTNSIHPKKCVIILIEKITNYTVKLSRKSL